ncbi:1,4-dihydroxy-2-naphthoate prenyltransferase [Streptomyces albus subsp. chlorinus]|uniref:UbiA family prenyltransferase n=1 Tax=Streptomyces albus TaxID=1888 RepID=UPI00156E8169|nr:UbiA family prenyltransferase [Streptomyces albus]NSC24372.1 1,4-dihydroxy-2-naphthoate prenyltransferase [Streptomyces albus subsp. chlorinus]
MTTHVQSGSLPATGPRPESKARSFARLGKLDVYDYYPSIAVALSAALLPLSRFGAAAVWTLALFLVGEVLVVMAMVALDDVTGYRDGSDAANYGPNDPLRRKLRKPLIAGTLSMREALAFAWITAAGGAALWSAAVVVAPHRPGWTLALVPVLFVTALQYSYGVKISYRGFQEVFLVALGVALVLAPYGLAAGRFSGFVLILGVLFGFGPLMFGVYSNTNDIPGDRAVGRPTVACLVSARGNAVFIGALSAAEFLVGAAGSATGVAPWWFVALMLPVTALRARQYLTGFGGGGGFGGGDIMRARRQGFVVHRVSTVLLICAGLLHGAEAAA